MKDLLFILLCIAGAVYIVFEVRRRIIVYKKSSLLSKFAKSRKMLDRSMNITRCNNDEEREKIRNVVNALIGMYKKSRDYDTLTELSLYFDLVATNIRNFCKSMHEQKRYSVHEFYLFMKSMGMDHFYSNTVWVPDTLIDYGRDD